MNFNLSSTDGVYFTSDTHIGHRNILTYCDRPWDDIPSMNRGLIDRWNQTVPPDGIVFHLGDVAMGGLAEHLPLVKELNGVKFLISGNHDQGYHNSKKVQKYLDAGFEEVRDELEITIDGIRFLLNHIPYPYVGPNHEESRSGFEARKLRVTEDNGLPIICGHVHDCWTQMWSMKGTPMLNVGVDVHDYRPIHISSVYNTMFPMV